MDDFDPLPTGPFTLQLWLALAGLLTRSSTLITSLQLIVVLHARALRPLSHSVIRLRGVSGESPANETQRVVGKIAPSRDSARKHFLTNYIIWIRSRLSPSELLWNLQRASDSSGWCHLFMTAVGVGGLL